MAVITGLKDENIAEAADLIKNFYDGAFGVRASSAFLKAPKKYETTLYKEDDEITGIVSYATNKLIRKTSIKLLVGDRGVIDLLLEELQDNNRLVIKVPKELSSYISDLLDSGFKKAGKSIDGLLVRLER